MKTDVDFGCAVRGSESVSNYRGMKPEFVQKVWAKRRREAARTEPVKLEPPVALDVLQAVEQILKTEFQSFAELRCIAAVLYGIPVKHIDDKTRDPRVTKARHAGICAAKRQWPHMSLSALGREFGVDHTSIFHALRKYGIGTAQPQIQAAKGSDNE